MASKTDQHKFSKLVESSKIDTSNILGAPMKKKTPSKPVENKKRKSDILAKLKALGSK